MTGRIEDSNRPDVTAQLDSLYEWEPSELDAGLRAAQARAVSIGALDIEGFRRWALGDLTDNRNRGLFAEWLVGQALEAVDEAEPRREWDAFDLAYGSIRIEVKASGRSQTWNPNESATPRFDIAPRRYSWVAVTDEWFEHDPPARLADVYVFCLHEPVPATNENVLDPSSWKFWVIATQSLDDELGSQKTAGLSTLDRLTEPVEWPDIQDEVDRAIGSA
ncbi:hypothetical protein [Candidatus Poriferisodalis sp.]|uniref:hypothetical protein n=1 Tax=Candidatus Poriferisodalis sp. TaxID=3101277 RepID=UPI003C6F2CCF